VQAVLPSVAAHRIAAAEGLQQGEALVRTLIESTRLP